MRNLNSLLTDTKLFFTKFVVDTVDFFPKSVNDWYAKRWGEKTYWWFLGDLKKSILDKHRESISRGGSPLF